MKNLTVLFTIILVLALTTNKAHSQRYDYKEDLYFKSKYQIELGGSLAAMNALTDLGGNNGYGGKFFKDINPGRTQLAASVYFAAYYRNFIGLRFEGTFGKVAGSDSDIKPDDFVAGFRYRRNLSFRSDIDEMMLVAEVHPLFAKKYSIGHKLPRISPYLLGGIGFFTFGPQARLNGEWVYLRSLSTEGQGFPEYPDRKVYSVQQFCFPVGGGLKYKFSPLFNFSAEVVYRILNTDYLDDVSTTYIDREVFTKHFTGKQLDQALLLNDRMSELDPNLHSFDGQQRGNPNSNDAYFTINFKVGVNF